MMTLRQIRHFIAVAETGSISAAAQTAFISQSTLTLAIQQLEQEIGVGVSISLIRIGYVFDASGDRKSAFSASFSLPR